MFRRQFIQRSERSGPLPATRPGSLKGNPFATRFHTATSRTGSRSVQRLALDAPPVYRPDNVGSGTLPHSPAVVQQRAAIPAPSPFAKAPMLRTAPPAYRPVIQQRAAAPAPSPFAKAPVLRAAPPVYRPVIQQHAAPPAPSLFAKAPVLQAAPPVYRPMVQRPAATSVPSPLATASVLRAAPPAYRPVIQPSVAHAAPPPSANSSSSPTAAGKISLAALTIGWPQAQARFPVPVFRPVQTTATVHSEAAKFPSAGGMRKTDLLGSRAADGRVAKPSPGLPSLLVQRKVGFELELQLPVSRYVPGEEAKPITNGKVLEAFKNQLLADVNETHKVKKEVYTRVYGHEDVYTAQWETDGWKVTADNTSRLGSHKANLEIQTHAIDTERLSPEQIRREIKQIFASITNWVEEIKAKNPKKNRIKISPAYTVGFPNTATMPAREWFDLTEYQWNEDTISYDAYVQINLGIPFHRVRSLTEYASTERNRFNDWEPEGAKVGAQVAGRLSDSGDIEKRDEPAVSGFLALLCVAMLGAKNVPTNTLVKKLWSILPKSGLHTWWKLQLARLSPTSQRNFAQKGFRDAIRGQCLSALGIPQSDRLLKRYRPGQLAELGTKSKIPIFQVAEGYTASAYFDEVIAGNRDLLVELSLQHQAKTGLGTSMLDVDTTRQGVPLGVMEVRNISTRWNYGTWEEKALQWARKAFELSGGGDWEEEEKLRAVAGNSWEDYMALRQYVNSYEPEF
jgi:hypothetical protein